MRNLRVALIAVLLPFTVACLDPMPDPDNNSDPDVLDEVPVTAPTAEPASSQPGCLMGNPKPNPTPTSPSSPGSCLGPAPTTAR